ncbi:MAG: cytidylate kinase-like family protein [Ruminococcaceae bacterium]|nr:cytidylate kinase-like family protein [Oscillospiraceae bacterium]
MKTVITLGRQLGSNGKLIGQALAEKLGYKFYDKDLIARVAKESGLSENLFDEMNEKPTSSLLYSLVMGVQSSKGLYYQYNDMLNGDSLFRLQADVIKSIAEEGPCIIVGRCADYILRNNPNLIKLFLYASPEERVKTLMARDNMTEKEARSAVNKADKRRSNYYNFYTNNSWGNVNNYHLCLDTASLTQDECVDFLYSYVKEREKSFND